jgi:hypothetical protein
MALTVLALVAAASLAAGGCTTDDDCSLLGVCSPLTGKCRCDPGWTGVECAEAALQPYDDVAHLGYVNSSRASWGGRPLKVGEKWQLFATEIDQQCPLILFMNNSMVIRAESTTDSPAGPYAHRAIVRPAFAHNPTAIGPTSDGYYLVYSIGGIAAGSAAPNPSSWLLDCTSGLPRCAKKNRCRSHGTPDGNGQVVMSYTKDPIGGPWTHRVVLPIGGDGTTPPNAPGAWNCKHNNPSALLNVTEGDAVTLMYHGSACDGSLKGERLGLADATHWNSSVCVAVELVCKSSQADHSTLTSLPHRHCTVYSPLAHQSASHLNFGTRCYTHTRACTRTHTHFQIQMYMDLYPTLVNLIR